MRVKLFYKEIKKQGLPSFMGNNINLHQDTDQKACRSVHFQGKSVSINIKITELRNLQYLNDIWGFAVMSLFSDTHVAGLWNLPGMPFPVEIRDRKFSSNSHFDSVHILLFFFLFFFIMKCNFWIYRSPPDYKWR